MLGAQFHPELRSRPGRPHPLFAAFVGSGDLTIQTGDRTDRVAIPRAHLAKLRRLADRCAG